MAERIIHNSSFFKKSSPFEHHGEIVVIGLGRFGTALADELTVRGHKVLAIDNDKDIVEQKRDDYFQVVSADTTQTKVLESLGVNDAMTAVVCIGNNIEASVLTTVNLVDLGIENIWAKAITDPHGQILNAVGAHHVVFPEAQMGVRVAHLVTGKLEDYMRLQIPELSESDQPDEDEFVLSQMIVPSRFAGRELGKAGIRAEHRVTVVCIRPKGGRFTYAEPGTILGPEDHIVVAGHPEDVERFADVR